MGDYITASDLRDLGVTTREASNADLTAVATLVSRQLEQWTRQWFEPRALTQYDLDGTGSHALFLPVPIISITSVTLLDTDGAVIETLATTAYKVYNRHLSNISEPDDRKNPKIELVQPFYYPHSRQMFFTRGRKNVRLNGKFGYTDYDGSADGKTPDLVKWVCKQMALRYVWPRGDYGSQRRAQSGFRMSKEKSGDQEFGMQNMEIGNFTGDPHIDRIIEMLMGPIEIGSV